MVKIVLVGAGSAVFSKNLIADILWHKTLGDARLVLVDTDPERLEVAMEMARSINASLGAHASISAASDRRMALDGADFVICTIGVGGLAATKDDIEVPLRFGVRQTIGDTLGVGGVFRAARSIPHLLAICRDMEELCPDALLLNYSNPMAMHCLAVERATRIRCVGLCHGLQMTAIWLRTLIALMDRPAEEINRHLARPMKDPKRAEEWESWLALGKDPDFSYTCAGINHMAFFLRLESAGQDLYPKLWQILDMPHLLQMESVRFELFRWLGYFMTESPLHTPEYTPYFLKDPAETAAHNLTVGIYIQGCENLATEYRSLADTVRTGRPVIRTPYQRTEEYASRILDAIVTDRPYVFYGNVPNHGGALIGNLPGDCCVEVPCLASKAGITPTFVGELPPQCAALIRTNVNVQDLAVRGILEGSRERIYQAVMMDPNTASTLTLGRIRELCDAMFAVHADRLPANLGSNHAR